jgi:1-acyl-sn-glycerol-3-phosphate acyltransferase
MTARADALKPVLSLPRKGYRAWLKQFFRMILRLTVDFEVDGTDHVPRTGPFLLVMNHLGLLDGPMVVATMPRSLEAVVDYQMLDVPVAGNILRWYGIVPVKRDQFDRNVLRQALSLLQSGRPVGISPEAGISGSGALREARNGAAYLALRADVPVLPAGITGTETLHGMWDAVTEKVSFRGLEQLAFWRRNRPRMHVHLRYGRPFDLGWAGQSWQQRRQAIEAASDEIMTRIAALLPESYRGAYSDVLERLGITPRDEST